MNDLTLASVEKAFQQWRDERYSRAEPIPEALWSAAEMQACLNAAINRLSVWVARWSLVSGGLVLTRKQKALK